MQTVSVGVQQARPPYVQFKRLAMEARDGSGNPISKDVDFAFITPVGSRDTVEKIVTDWFLSLQQQVRDQRFPAAWLNEYKAAYDMWKTDQTVATNGTPIQNWPVLSPSQIKNLTNWHVRTVEDVALMNVETMQRIGMGAVGLKQLAVDFLATKENEGATALLIVELRNKLSQAVNRIAQLEESNQALKGQVSQREQAMAAAMPMAAAFHGFAPQQAQKAQMDDIDVDLEFPVGKNAEDE